MKNNFFKPYTAYRLGKGTSLTSDYINALLIERFIVTTDGLEYNLRTPKGEVVFSHIQCKDCWKLFLESIPKCLLPVKTLLKYVQGKTN